MVFCEGGGSSTEVNRMPPRCCSLSSAAAYLPSKALELCIYWRCAVAMGTTANQDLRYQGSHHRGTEPSVCAMLRLCAMPRAADIVCLYF